ncbi:metallophosphoesterase [Rufibacter sp. LB8]|uniref:metallophosphoesterase family protein n=1 Tax=Rufibacter sp. LB8 TaxID=2777781 RepID=UPI00178C5A89|nr:metallophosphoesterase [Rufibacter sp. LB8]
MKTLNRRQLCGWLAFLLLLPFSSCDLFDYHPYEGNVTYKNLTAENVARIKALESTFPAQATLKFAFISDTHNFFEEKEAMVKDINSRNVAFVLHGGDITNYGFTDEFERSHRVLSKLNAPYVTVIGNHDCLGDGDKIYQAMYGPLNHSFTFKNNKFIFLNSNFLEFDASVPDLDYLQRELQAPADITNKFVVAHISPDHGEANPAKAMGYATLMQQFTVGLSLHGHIHGHTVRQPYNDGITYLTTASANKRNYVMVTVTGNTITHEVITF